MIFIINRKITSIIIYYLSLPILIYKILLLVLYPTFLFFYKIAKLALVFTINVWKGIYGVIKQMEGWKAKLSFFLSFMLLEGWAILLIILGTVFQNPKMIGIGSMVVAIWLGPGTPLLILILAFALVIQKFIFFDKSITWKNIKNEFKKAFTKEVKKDD